VYVASVSEKSADYARSVRDKLADADIRVELDVSAEKIGPKKHYARKQKIPYTLVVGEKESAENSVNVNDRKGKTIGNESVDAFVARCTEEIASRKVGIEDN
jgi:threonyl-tRNA synthetase